MKNKKEFLLCVSAILFVITLIDIGVMKYLLVHIDMNNMKFNAVGMMEYTNPNDHRKLYIPIYEKGDK